MDSFIRSDPEINGFIHKEKLELSLPASFCILETIKLPLTSRIKQITTQDYSI